LKPQVFWDDDASLGEQSNDWLLDPEEEGNTMLRNVRNYSPTTKRYILKNMKLWVHIFFVSNKKMCP
jgi:hypothetical protein